MARQVQTSNNDKTLIKQIMRDKGISVAELAERMGRAQPTISNLLVKQNMTIDTLSNFAEALGGGDCRPLSCETRIYALFRNT